MKKFLALILTGSWILGVSLSTAYAQKDEAFAKKETQAAVAVDTDQYIIGAEDVLYVHVWKEEALSKTISVRMDGKISLPLIDEIQAAGMTPLQLREVLIRRFQEFVDVPNVSVMVMETNSFKVFISGEIKNPGVFRLRNETTILQIISMAGGFTEWAKQREVIVIRKEKDGERRILVNYKKIISGEELSSNILLKSGDTIIIP